MILAFQQNFKNCEKYIFLEKMPFGGWFNEGFLINSAYSSNIMLRGLTEKSSAFVYEHLEDNGGEP